MFKIIQKFFGIYADQHEVPEENKFEENGKNNDDENDEENDTLKSGSIDPNNMTQTNELKSNLLLRKGAITAVKCNVGVIDNFITFDLSEASHHGFNDLNVGYHVEYLSNIENGKINVVKIEKVVKQFWGDDPLDNQLTFEINQLKDEAPKLFNNQYRHILGIITERRSEDIIIDTDKINMIVRLDDIEIEFVPKKGDRVQLICTVKMSDEPTSFNNDELNEIVNVKRVEPVSIQRDVMCRVECVYKDFAVLNDDGYVLFEDMASGLELHIDDILKADLIECERGDFKRRCIKLSVLEKSFGLLKSFKNPKLSRTLTNQAISFYGEDRCVVVGIHQKKTIVMKMKNNCAVEFKVVSVEFEKRNRITQLRLLQPPATGFLLEPKGELSLVFEVSSIYLGESSEYFSIKLEKFRIKKMITVVVIQSQSEASAAERRLIASSLSHWNNERSIGLRSRKYAAQVWSTKMEIVPGECIATKRRFVAVRISHHEVPDMLAQTYMKSVRKMDMKNGIEAMYSCLRESLTFKNYVQRFQLLIHLEEIEYYINFRNYDRELAHFERCGDFLSLTIENLAERRPSIVIGDIVRAFNPHTIEFGDARCFEGIVHKVLHNRILLKFNSSFQEKYNGEDYRLRFHYSRFIFRKQHHALQNITKHLGEQFLFPSKVSLSQHPQLEVHLDNEQKLCLYDTELKWFNPLLNTVQKRAVYNILRGETENMPYIIFGPPGTGKTLTLIETMLQLVRNLPSSRLLVGTPSNSSADLITQRLIESGVLQRSEFVRLVSQNLIEKDSIPSRLKPYCATVDIGSNGTCEDNMVTNVSGLKLRCQMNYLARFRITISTCTTMGNYLQMNFPSNHFTHVFVDEAGQCTEPETIVPITLVTKRRGKVILAGDPHQLQAIVINRYAGEKGYSLSLLERILERTPYKKDMLRFVETSGYNPKLVTKLIYNYRALPSIMNIYNTLFYDSELKSVISDVNSREAMMLQKIQPALESFGTKRSVKHGAFFYGICSENVQENDSPSWYNPGEAKSIFFMTIRLYRNNIKPDDIGILTPYMKQAKYLREMFIHADIAMPKIGSVEEFQGQERDIILISTVRSTESYLDADSRYSLGFVRCVKRMNVATSRARYLMIIYGNPHLLALDEYWRQLIMYTYKSGAYAGCKLPLSVIKNDIDVDDDDVLSDISELSLSQTSLDF